MKNKAVLVPTCLLLFSLLLMGCGKKSGGGQHSTLSSSSESEVSLPSSIDSSVEETYLIQFVSKGEVVYSVENAHYGDYIDIPVIEAKEGARETLSGWLGISDEEMAMGKVMVYESDATYTAIWKERFGTETVFGAPRLKIGESIALDGERDDAYLDCHPIAIEAKNGDDVAAKAKAYLMWDESNIYSFIEVEDPTYVPHQEGYSLHGTDSLDLFIDLLHSDELAEFGYEEGWGGIYRGEPGPMCEGWFTIKAGAEYPKGEVRYGNDSIFWFEGWLSNAAKESGNTVGTTVQTAKGYNVEYRIDCTNPRVPVELQPHLNQEIGLGINVFDQEDSGGITQNTEKMVSMEAINGEMKKTPKRLSNIQLIANPRDNYEIINATQVRDGFEVTSKDEQDAVFKDAAVADLDDTNSLLTLWDEKGFYLYVNMSGTTESIDIEIPSLSKTYSLNERGKAFIPMDSLEVGSFANAVVTITDLEKAKTTNEYLLYCVKNTNNTDPARKLFTANKLASSEEIVVDGEKDDAYSVCEEIDISSKTLVERVGLAASGKAYMKWDDDFFYVFVDVKDANVDTGSAGDPWANDSVELWVSTCRTLPSLDTGWGDANRPTPSYCGEGGFRLRAGDETGANLTGMHWMFDWKDGVPRQAASKTTETGYTAEYKISWAAFAGVKNKEETIIDMNLNINDGENSIRKGIVSTNMHGHETYLRPAYLDHVKLVG